MRAAKIVKTIANETEVVDSVSKKHSESKPKVRTEHRARETETVLNLKTTNKMVHGAH